MAVGPATWGLGRGVGVRPATEGKGQFHSGYGSPRRANDVLLSSSTNYSISLTLVTYQVIGFDEVVGGIIALLRGYKQYGAALLLSACFSLWGCSLFVCSLRLLYVSVSLPLVCTQQTSLRMEHLWQSGRPMGSSWSSRLLTSALCATGGTGARHCRWSGEFEGKEVWL